MIEPKIDSASINPEWKGHAKSSHGVEVKKRKKYKLLGGELIETDTETGATKTWRTESGDKLDGNKAK